jgi:hypothetical protein
MKVVHSYIPIHGQNHLYKEAIYVQLLSALLANREYGEIDFYTNEDIKRQVTEIGFPYKQINSSILSGKFNDVFSIPKLMVFKEMNEPFIHIDADTFIYKKIDFSNVNSVMFSHPDIPVPEHIDLRKKASEICQSYPNVSETDYFFKSSRVTYLDLFDKLLNSETKKRNIRVCEIPNMNIIAVKNYNDFKLASEMSLKHYYENRDEIFKSKNGACYIEQLMIHLNLMEISSEYYNDVKSNKTFLMKGAPNKIVGNHDWPKADLEFPLIMLQYSPSDEYTSKEIKIDNLYYTKTDQDIYVTGHTGKLTQFNTLEELPNYFDFDFYGVIHLSYYKWNDFFQALIIGQIAKMFGENYLESVYGYFQKNFFSETSSGEKLYEKLTGYKFKKQNTLI